MSRPNTTIFMRKGHGKKLCTCENSAPFPYIALFNTREDIKILNMGELVVMLRTRDANVSNHQRRFIVFNEDLKP